MPQGRKTEEILRELIRNKGIAYLREGSLFVNAVEDMGGTQKDIQLLHYLVETEGHLALLDGGRLTRVQQA